MAETAPPGAVTPGTPAAPSPRPIGRDRERDGGGVHARPAHRSRVDRRRRALRPPDLSLEPEDEELHLRRAQRHPHRRPRPDARALPGSARVPARDRPRAVARCSSSAPSDRPPRRCRRKSRAASQLFVNNRWLGGTLTNFRTVKKSLDRFKEQLALMADETGWNELSKKDRSRITRDVERYEKSLDGLKEMTKLPGGDVPGRREARAHRGLGGTPARHPDRRGGRHQLRSRRHRLRDPRQRRRDARDQPLLRPGRRRLHRRRPTPRGADPLRGRRGSDRAARRRQRRTRRAWAAWWSRSSSRRAAVAARAAAGPAVRGAEPVEEARGDAGRRVVCTARSAGSGAPAAAAPAAAESDGEPNAD